MVRAQYLRQEFADRNPLGHEYALQLMQSKTCPACFKQHLQGGGMIAFPGALYKEIASGSVCVPVAFLDDGRIDMEPVSVEAFLPQEVVVAVKSDKTTLW